MIHEPLQPPPRWVYTGGAGSHDATALVTSSRVGSPADFVLGYEQGAYALARNVLALMVAHKEADAIKLLLTYNAHDARPVRGWEHEPKRN